MYYLIDNNDNFLLDFCIQFIPCSSVGAKRAGSLDSLNFPVVELWTNVSRSIAGPISNIACHIL